MGDATPGLADGTVSSLWPDGAWDPDPTRDVRRRFAAVPPVGEPKWLVEVGRTAAAAGAFAPQADGATLAHRLPWLAARLLVRAGGLAVLPHHVIGSTSEEYGDSPLARLEELLGAGPLHVAVPIQKRRAHTKHVVRLTDADGTRSWFAKLAVSDETARLVRHEAAVLRRLGSVDLGPVLAPSVAWSGRIADREVLVVTEHARRGLLQARPAAPAPDHFAAVAASGEHATGPLGATDQAHDVRALAASEAERPDGDPAVAARLSELVGRTAEVVVPLGAWHGDWVPQNTAWGESHLALWDWEFYATGVPVGLDVVHYWFQRLLWSDEDRDVARALAVTGATAGPVLTALGVRPELHEALLDHYRCVYAHRLLSPPEVLRTQHLRLARAVLGLTPTAGR